MKIIASLCIATFAAAVNLKQHVGHLHAQTMDKDPIETAINNAVGDIWEAHDDDNSYYLDKDEATDVYLKMNPDLSDDEIDDLHDELDEDGDGEISK